MKKYLVLFKNFWFLNYIDFIINFEFTYKFFFFYSPIILYIFINLNFFFRKQNLIDIFLYTKLFKIFRSTFFQSNSLLIEKKKNYFLNFRKYYTYINYNSFYLLNSNNFSFFFNFFLIRFFIIYINKF